MTTSTTLSQICTQPRESQCKFFEWHDEAKLSNGNGTGNVMPQSTNHQLPKLSQPQITGPLCNCQLPSIIRTTMKEGPNHKRNFWVSEKIIIIDHAIHHWR